MADLNRYDVDFYGWTQEQAMLLRDQQFNQVDWPNLIDEVESLGKQQRQELRNRLIPNPHQNNPIPNPESRRG